MILIMYVIYTMIAIGVAEVTDEFWKSVLWPYHAGMVIGQAVNARKCSLKS